MRQRQQASPSRGRGPGLGLRGTEGGSRAPVRMLIASYRLWSSPPPAEPKCFPPSSHSSLGTQGAGAGLESQPAPAPGRLSLGRAPERTRCSAQGRPRRWERARDRDEAAAAAAAGRGAGCRCGRRPAGGAAGAARGWAARAAEAPARWQPTLCSACPRARSPLASPARAPPLTPAAESTDAELARRSGQTPTQLRAAQGPH